MRFFVRLLLALVLVGTRRRRCRHRPEAAAHRAEAAAASRTTVTTPSPWRRLLGGVREARTGLSLRARARTQAKCGLKLSSEGGAGLWPRPKPLVRADGRPPSLRRGFAREARSPYATVKPGQSPLKPASCPRSLSKDQPDAFEGFPVLAWETQLAPGWAGGDSAPALREPGAASPGNSERARGATRAMSVLPKTLIDEVDFWINLPVLSDSKLAWRARRDGRGFDRQHGQRRTLPRYIPSNAARRPPWKSAPSRELSKPPTC